MKQDTLEGKAKTRNHKFIYQNFKWNLSFEIVCVR